MITLIRQSDKFVLIRDLSGRRGTRGWSPEITAEIDQGVRGVLRITDWVLGEGEKPAIGYIAAGGLVSDPADALDFLDGFQAARDAAEIATAAAVAATSAAVSATAAAQAVVDASPALLAAAAAAQASAVSAAASAASAQALLLQAVATLFSLTPVVINDGSYKITSADHGKLLVFSAGIALSSIAYVGNLPTGFYSGIMAAGPSGVMMRAEEGAVSATGNNLHLTDLYATKILRSLDGTLNVFEVGQAIAPEIGLDLANFNDAGASGLALLFFA